MGMSQISNNSVTLMAVKTSRQKRHHNVIMCTVTGMLVLGCIAVYSSCEKIYLSLTSNPGQLNLASPTWVEEQ